MKSIPNILSASRGIAAIIMLFFPVFSTPFLILYGWCGLSDMIDGPLARKMKATSELGSRIDSLADLVFVICACIRILPELTLPEWIWIWVGAIGILKVAIICIYSLRQHKFIIKHSLTNKLTGFLLFCLPFSIFLSDAIIPAAIVCTTATISLFEEY